MTTIGIDIGGRSHAVARCRDGQTRADRELLRVSQSRAGFTALDSWLDRQVEPVTLVAMESSGHYWMPLASHLRRREVPVAVVNPLAAKYFAKSRLARTKSDPADARSLAEMAMRDTPPSRDPLAGAELRQAARFAMTLVTEQAKVCQRLIRLVELGFPELGELFDDPTCRTAREILRIAPTAQAATRRRTSTLANANAGPGHRRLGPVRAERLQAAAADSIAVPELDAEVPSRSTCCSTSTTCSRARSRRRMDTLPASLTARSPGDCRPFPASAHPSRPHSSPKSAISAGSRISTSCWPMPASIRPSAARARRAPTPRPPGT